MEIRLTRAEAEELSRRMQILTNDHEILGIAGEHFKPGARRKSRLDGKEEEIRLLLNKEVSVASIAKILDISRTALRHFILTRKLQ